MYNSKKYYDTGINVANVSYNYNYEGAPNAGYYWLDDYDGEIIKFIPPTPTREGYEFGGWYKEPECINQWDFENNLIASKIYDENNDYVYIETILYAKWN